MPSNHARGRADHARPVERLEQVAAAAGLVPGRSLTTAEVAARYRVSSTKVRAWIASGKLAALNTADATCAKPRYIVTPESLAAFERERSTLPAPKSTRRRRASGAKDYFPGD